MGKSSEEWAFDRSEAMRLIADLVAMDVSMENGLLMLFKRLQDDETVQIDGLEKRVQKKLRHLFKSMKFVESGSKAWKRPKKVKVKKLLKEMLKEIGPPAAVAEPEPKRARVEPEGPAIEGPAMPAQPSRIVKGPMRPTAEMLAAASARVAEDSDGEDGPAPEGAIDAYAARRQDLDSIVKPARVREEWMVDPGDKLRGAFEGPKEAIVGDRYAVKRSREEEEAFEMAFRARGASLMDEVQSGKFNAKDLRAAREKYEAATASSDLWGMSARNQMVAGELNSGGRRAFDPEKDLEMKRPMAQSGFQNLINDAKSVNDRFKRSGVATSFL